MAMTPLHAILDAIAGAKNAKDRKTILEKRNNQQLRDILKVNFDESVVLNLPEGEIPEGMISPKGDNQAIYKVLNLVPFVKYGPGHRVPAVQREKAFFDMLTAMHPRDAEIILLAKDRKLQTRYKGLTKKLVQDVWPGLIKE